jgi:curved DNA-binding protein CbpA
MQVMKKPQKKQEITDYYKLLNVPYNATIDQITEAYRTIAKDCALLLEEHQEMKKKIESEFSLYQQAFKTLTNIHEKNRYDLNLRLLELKNKEEILKNEKALQLKKEIEERVKIDKEEKLKREREARERLKYSLQNELKSNTDNKPLHITEPLAFTFSQFKIVDIDQNKLNRIYEEKQAQNKKTEEMLNSAKQAIREEDYDYSIDILSRLIELNPHDSTFHSYFGVALLKKGWENLSVEEFELALNLNPDDSIALQYYRDNELKVESPVILQNETKNKGLISKLKKIFDIQKFY